MASLLVQSAAEISKTALDCSDALAIEAVDLFCAIIGAEAGHMGLRSLASGGVYICGGIMPKVRLFLLGPPAWGHGCWVRLLAELCTQF